MSRCRGEVLPNQGDCNNIGCCFISLQQDISGFQATIVRADGMAARSDSVHPGIIMAFMGNNYPVMNVADVSSSWTDASKIIPGLLEVAIMDQPSCERAQTNNASYACATNSYCANTSYGGYTCYYSNNYYTVNNNPYLSDGCTPQQGSPSCFPLKPEHI